MKLNGNSSLWTRKIDSWWQDLFRPLEWCWKWTWLTLLFVGKGDYVRKTRDTFGSGDTTHRKNGIQDLLNNQRTSADFYWYQCDVISMWECIPEFKFGVHFAFRQYRFSWLTFSYLFLFILTSTVLLPDLHSYTGLWLYHIHLTHI